jgi:hypothetical protein
MQTAACRGAALERVRRGTEGTRPIPKPCLCVGDLKLGVLTNELSGPRAAVLWARRAHTLFSVRRANGIVFHGPFQRMLEADLSGGALFRRGEGGYQIGD